MKEDTKMSFLVGYEDLTMRENMISEELELAKVSLENANTYADIKSNPVVESVLMPLIKAVPVIGDMIDSSMNKVIEEFQEKKEKELLEVILKDKNSITSEMVNDVEFIVNFARIREAVRRLATNDKVKYFGNLIRNGYLSGEHIENSEFEEYLDILNSMSYREIQYLTDYKKYCDEKNKNAKRQYSNRWSYFRRDYTRKHQIPEGELWSAFVRIKRTGFIEEEYETESGDVDAEDNTFNSLTVDSNGFCIDDSFNRFYDMVLNMEIREGKRN